MNQIIWELYLIVMLKAFQMFDSAKEGLIETFKVATILKSMNLEFDEDELAEAIKLYDQDSKAFSYYSN